MARKTIEVETVKELGNRMIASLCEMAPEATAQRMAIAGMLEAVLHETGNYRGFSYLDGADAVRAGEYDESARHYT